MGTNLNAIDAPIASGTLSTEFVAGDSEGRLQEMASDICDLLTFALARDVKWIACGCFTNEGKSQKEIYRAPGLFPFNQHGTPTIDNWVEGNLTRFLEVASLPLQEAREWWSFSISLLMQARGSKYLEVKCSLLNTLLDRLTTRVLGDSTTPEIDANLSVRLDEPEVFANLHSILSSLTPNWERCRTESLVTTIKNWNKAPSFPNKIKRACEKLGISPMSGKKLRFRHVVIHEGVIHSDLKSDEERFQYFCELEALALLIMCRMLGFDGRIVLQIVPPTPKRVAEFLAVLEGGA